MTGNVSTWALPRLARILPLDEESLKEIIAYSSSLTKEAGAEHLRNILGDSPAALEFITGFSSRREEVRPQHHTKSQPATPTHTDTENTPSPRKRGNKKARAPLHNAGPARQPEGYGDVSGGYQKSYGNDNYLNTSKHQEPFANALANALSSSQNTAGLQLPKTARGSSPSPHVSRDASPGTGSARLPPSAAGNLISDLPNVRSKQSKKPAHPVHSGTSTPRGTAQTTTTSSIQDLTAAIAALELATNPTLSKERRRCDCNASLHPLFETAPNCLSCGKIICALEGLQPCSFCDSPILSKVQVDSMIRALKDERGVERMATHNAGVASGRGTPMFGASTPDSSSGDEASSAALRARAHRDKLLAFQRENAQRTRVHDEAADYDATLTPGTTQWMSPVQRAAALKRQQKYIRELQEASKPEWERKRTVMSMSIKNGKLVRTFERQQAPATDSHKEEDLNEEELRPPADSQSQSESASHRIGKNPLLVSGKLIRPVWKPKHDTAETTLESSARPKQSIWRRVQDDNEDNEQWILDGGIHGHGIEKMAEDGSQQECG